MNHSYLFVQTLSSEFRSPKVGISPRQYSDELSLARSILRHSLLRDPSEAEMVTIAFTLHAFPSCPPQILAHPSGSSEAPPTNTPSILGCDISSAALSGLTLPP